MWCDAEEDDYFDRIEVINVNKIYISNSILRAVKRSGTKLNSKEFKMDPSPAPTPLKSLDKIDVFDNSPIKVKKVDDYYSIIDGRHRFAKSLSMGMKQVSVEVIDFSIC